MPGSCKSMHRRGIGHDRMSFFIVGSGGVSWFWDPFNCVLVICIATPVVQPGAI